MSLNDRDLGVLDPSLPKKIVIAASDSLVLHSLRESIRFAGESLFFDLLSQEKGMHRHASAILEKRAELVLQLPLFQQQEAHDCGALEQMMRQTDAILLHNRFHVWRRVRQVLLQTHQEEKARIFIVYYSGETPSWMDALPQVSPKRCHRILCALPGEPETVPLRAYTEQAKELFLKSIGVSREQPADDALLQVNGRGLRPADDHPMRFMSK